jgi:outer membrane protein OmpA-like peptidoglycan-associated protein
MSKNLLELLNAHLTEDVVSKIAHFIGESTKNTGSALGSALPSLLSGLIHKSEDSQGASILFNLLTQNHDSGLLSNLGASLVGGDVTTKMASTGGSLLSSIFGNKSEGIANVVADASGISKQSSTSLLGLLMPIVFAVLGKTLKAQQITSPTGLAGLLGEQSGFLKNLLPAGLAGLFGVSAVAVGTAQSAPASASVHAVDENITRKTETPVTSFAKEKIDEPYVAPVVRERKIVPPPPPVEDDDAGIFGKLLPWLILGSILALGWGIWKNLKKSVDTTPPVASTSSETTPAPAASTETTTAAPATPSAEGTTPATSDTMGTPATPPEQAQATTTPTDDNAKAAFEQKLPSGYVLKASSDSMESKLYAFINDASAKIDKDKWFTMDGVTFDTGKATLKSESGAQMANITEILKAFPKVKIKIGGYTDNTGNAKSNHKLSADRASTIKAALVKAGIDKARLDAEGYGSNHPVATNDTAEGRQQNRRIDVRVTEK